MATKPTCFRTSPHAVVVAIMAALGALTSFSTARAQAPPPPAPTASFPPASPPGPPQAGPAAAPAAPPSASGPRQGARPSPGPAPMVQPPPAGGRSPWAGRRGRRRPANEYPRKPVELFLGLGFGNAVCDNERPDSDCPVDGALTLGLGGGWRFHDHWSVGLEIATWQFAVRDEWQGQLQDEATDVRFSSTYFAPYVRWYWFDDRLADPYLHGGIGFGTVQARAENDAGSYEARTSGIVYHLGIGVEWQLAEVFRLGPQALAYLHVGNEICEDTGDSRGERCRDPRTDEHGDREGLALPWRLMVIGTFTFGGR